MRTIWNWFRGIVDRPKVWLVDDRDQNRTDFSETHNHYFDVQTFSKPGELLDALKRDTPDALLCDIYFYDDPIKREQVEEWVEIEAAKLRDGASKLAPTDARQGIRLIEEVREYFGGPPSFPIYAFTSKGPYLLQDEGFRRLEDLQAQWLFKGHLDAGHVRHRLTSDIRTFRDKHDWRRRMWSAAVRAGLVGAFAGIVFDRILKYAFGW